MRPFALLSIFGVLLFCSPAQAFDACTDGKDYTPVNKRYTKGLLFKIEKCHEPVSYVFGTTHLARPDVEAAAAGAFTALKQVQEAGFELSESGDELEGSFFKYAYAPAGPEHQLSHVLGAEYYNKLVAELGFLSFLHGNYIKPEILQRLQPWAVLDLLEVVNEQQGMVLDEKLQVAATLTKKPVFGLETVEEQAQVFSTLPEAIQLRMLREMIDHYPEFMKAETDMIKAYVAQDGNTIMALDKQNITEGDKDLDDMMEDRMITKRNIVMAQRLLPRLKSKSILLSVGVAHLLGEKGLLHLLEKDGYFVTPMP